MGSGSGLWSPARPAVASARAALGPATRSVGGYRVAGSDGFGSREAAADTRAVSRRLSRLSRPARHRRRGRRVGCSASLMTAGLLAKYAAAGPANPLGSNLAVSPAAKRANGLRAHIALVSERYAAFDQPPLTEHQLYRLRLRTAGPSFKECTTASKLLIDGPFYWALQLGVQLAQKTTSSIRRCSVK